MAGTVAMRLRLEEAWLPGGWARGVGLEIERGRIARAVPDAPPGFGGGRGGPPLPGPPDLPSPPF